MTLEISPTTACNHRCVFCAFDYGKAHQMPPEMLTCLVRNIADAPTDDKPAGITWGGEGEPCLHPNLLQAMTTTAQAGISNGLTTNGSRPVVKSMLPFLSWVRFSVNALDAELYGKIHGVDPRERKKVLETVEACVNAKKEQNHRVIIGVQALLLNENEEDILPLAQAVKRLGVDYFTVKPYSKHPQSQHTADFSFDTARLGPIKARLDSIATDSFATVLRDSAFGELGKAKPYDHCLAASFFHFVDSHADVYSCAQFVGNPMMRMGNLHVQAWHEFLSSVSRGNMISYLANLHECRGCRHPCRLHETNLYLERVVSPLENDGFI
jgi:radical SAM protein with 4Fe4S-binding SPASM domain